MDAKRFRHRGVDALDALFGEKLIRNNTAIGAKIHHPFGKYQLVPPIEIGFEQTDRSKLVNEVVAHDFLQQYCEPSAPASQWDTLSRA